MTRLSSYPRETISVSRATRDAHGNLETPTVFTVEDVVWKDEVRRVTIGNMDLLTKSNFVCDKSRYTPAKDDIITLDGQEFTVIGYVRFRSYELVHYQVFLS